MSYTRILRWVLLLGSSLVFFIPFIIADGGAAFSAPLHQGNFLYIPWPNSFFPFIVGKNFVFRILVEILFGVWVLLALREPKYRPKGSYIMWALVAFVAWLGIATIFSVDPVKSFWSNFERMEGYITILHLFAYFLIVSTVVVVENWWNRLAQVSIATSAVMGLSAMLQLAGLIAISSQSGPRVDTTFGNAIYLAVYMLFNIFLTLLMLIRQRKSTTAQAAYGVALVLQFAALYFTETRGALLGVIGGLIVAGIFIAWRARERQWQTLRKVSYWGLGVIAVLIVVFFAIRHTSFVQHNSTLNRLASISLNDTTTRARIFYIWPMALKGSVDSPKAAVVGWGPENFNFVFNKYYTPQMYNQEQWFDRAHNQFLDWLVAGGYPAFALYIALFIFMVLAVVRSELSVPEQAVLLGLLAAYAFNNLTVFDDISSSIYFFLILALMHGLSRKELPSRMFLAKPVGDRGIAVAAPIVVVAGVLCIWCVNVPGIARAQNLLTAIEQQKLVNGMPSAKDPKDNLAEFQVALGRNAWPGTPLGQQEVTEQLLQFASAEGTATTIDPAVRQDTYNLAEQAGVAMNAQRKHDARLELFMGAFYDSFGQYSQAITWLQSALADSPKKQQIMFELGVADINSGNTQEALPILKAAFDEEPNYKDARILYAAALYYAKDTQDADQLLLSGPADEGFGTLNVDDQRLLQVYANLKMYDRLVSVWKARVEKDPNNAQMHVGLAAAYFAKGDKADTIAELQAASKLDPTVAPQAEALIKQIQNGTLKPGQ